MACRIEDYGLIGDCETAALVGIDGSIDWLCWPAFDSDACFAALLGTSKEGRWLIAPAEKIAKTTRRYRGDSLILETRFETASGTVAVIDFMPPRGKASDIVRLVRGVSGRVKLRMELVIRFGFGTDIPWVKKSEDGSALLAICGPDMTVLRGPIETRGEDMTTVADFEVGEGETVPFVLTYGPSHLDVPGAIDPEKALQEAQDFWAEWSGRCTYKGQSRDLVMRSLITLKALTYEPTGGTGKAWRGSDLSFGDYGLKVMECGYITDRQIEASPYRDDPLHQAWRQGLAASVPGQADHEEACRNPYG